MTGMTDYKTLTAQLAALVEGENSLIPVLANASALLFQTLNDINWAGFYIVTDGEYDKNNNDVTAFFKSQNL